MQFKTIRTAIARYQEATRPARLGFIIDATGSRADTWEQAQAAQRRMFAAAARSGRFAVRLIHYGGAERTDLGWVDSPAILSAAMAGVRCVRGLTQILPSLLSFLADDPEQRPQAVILVGDCFEEDVSAVAAAAAALKAAGIKVYSVHEGEDELARSIFRMLAEHMGGRLFKLGEDLRLGDLCEALAALTTGGQKALLRLTHNSAVPLLLPKPADKQGR